MSETEVFNVETREKVGTSIARQMRRAGKIPAVLYGHGQETVKLTLKADEVAAAVRHGSKIIDLKGAVDESALIRDMTFDTFGAEVLHVDFMRVSKDERVEVEVPVETRGNAPGAREGGVVQQVEHTVVLETTAASVPDVLSLNVNELQLDGELKAKDIEDLPPQAKLITDPETVMVTCFEPREEIPEEEGLAVESAEPEVIGRKEDEEEGEGEGDS